MAQELYDLPAGWEWRKFKDVCQLKRGYDLPKQSRVEGVFPLFSANGVTDYINQFKVKAPGVVTGRSGTIGKVHFVDNDFWPLNTALYVQDFKGNDERFILFFLKMFDLTRFASGAAVPTLNRNSLSSESVCIPDSIGEQKRIVAKLDALFTRIDTAITHLQQTLEFSKALFASALDEKFDYLTKNAPLRKFGDIVVNHDGKRVPIKASERKTTHGTYPYYGATGIIDYVDGYIFDGERLLISEDGANLVARKYPIAFRATGKYWVNNHAHIVDATPDITSNQFLEVFFAWTDLSRFITGSAQPKLNQKKLNSIVLPVPSLDEQKRIVAHLDALSERIRTLEASTQEKVNDLTSLKASLLDAAFKGQL